MAQGDRSVFPGGPAPILGIAFHAVAEAAARGGLPGNPDERREAAWQLFEQKAVEAHSKAHPLVRWRYPTPRHLPYFSLLQAEAAENVQLASTTYKHGLPSRYVERELISRDGTVRGRIDLIDLAGQVVIDYKSGFISSEDDQNIKDNEARQLRLYAFLCAENGIDIQLGVIVRQSGRRTEIPITPAEAQHEAHVAQSVREQINNRIAQSASIEELANPSAQNCRFCSCRPICEPFWRESQLIWMDEMACCVEGIVTSVERLEWSREASLIIELDVKRGISDRGIHTTDAIPAILAEADESSTPHIGQTLRLMDVTIDNGSRTLRARRNSFTCIWTV